MLLQHAFGTHENMWNVLFSPPQLSTVSLQILSPLLSLTSSHALWMSWDAASRVCGVCCCLLRSNNILAPLAPCPAPASSATPDRRLTCADSWHGYCPHQIQQLHIGIHDSKTDLCLQKAPPRISPGVKCLLVFMRGYQVTFCRRKPHWSAGLTLQRLNRPHGIENHS